ncbi:MAG: FadR/GntR family transcriptional regulator [Candidatus Pelethousia sp.]|nr:FadR/GntR family transcriptional regulator [Candidatus Pelethousia sp.]
MQENSEQQFAPIKKVNLSQKLVDYFIQQIENGNFAIGERIPNEINLATQLNVSRNILRESMKILENYGILHTVNGKGTMVSPSAISNIRSAHFFEKLRNDTDALQLLDARFILEPEIAYHACERCTQEDIQKLQCIVSMPLPMPATDGHADDDYDFHIVLSKACGNETLTEFLYILLYRLREGEYANFNKYVERVLREKSRQEHELILEALIQHQPLTARKVMAKHLSDRMNIIKTLYRSDIDPSGLSATAINHAMRES